MHGSHTFAALDTTQAKKQKGGVFLVVLALFFFCFFALSFPASSRSVSVVAVGVACLVGASSVVARVRFGSLRVLRSLPASLSLLVALACGALVLRSRFGASSASAFCVRVRCSSCGRLPLHGCRVVCLGVLGVAAQNTLTNAPKGGEQK